MEGVVDVTLGGSLVGARMSEGISGSGDQARHAGTRQRLKAPVQLGQWRRGRML